MDSPRITVDCPQTLFKVCRDVKAKEADANLGLQRENGRLEDLLMKVCADQEEIRKLAEAGLQMKMAKLYNATRARTIRELGEALYNGMVYQTGNY